MGQRCGRTFSGDDFGDLLLLKPESARFSQHVRAGQQRIQRLNELLMAIQDLNADVASIREMSRPFAASSTKTSKFHPAVKRVGLTVTRILNKIDRIAFRDGNTKKLADTAISSRIRPETILRLPINWMNGSQNSMVSLRTSFSSQQAIQYRAGQTTTNPRSCTKLLALEGNEIYMKALRMFITPVYTKTAEGIRLLNDTMEGKGNAQSEFKRPMMHCKHLIRLQPKLLIHKKTCKKWPLSSVLRVRWKKLMKFSTTR